jgi:uncharacterized protein (TIGR02996 family)
MHDHAGLLQAILAAPDDDTPRLILADWYEDNGDPARAELIRLQVQRAVREGGWLRRYIHAIDPDCAIAGFVREACRNEDSLPIVTEPDSHETQLLAANRERWLAGLPIDLRFDRGLPERLETTAWEYLRHAEALARLTPVLSVELTCCAPWQREDLEELGYEDEEEAEVDISRQFAQCQLLESWVELDFVGCPGGAMLDGILASPHLKNVRRIVATNNESGGAVVAVARDHFSRLRWLDLYDSDSASGEPGDEEFIDIVTCAPLSNLEYLNFGMNEVGDEGLAALASSPTMSRLRSLGLGSNSIGRAGWEALAKSRTVDNLRHLDLSSSRLDDRPGDAGLAVLLASPLFRRLRHLEIDSSGISDEGIARLARSPTVANLRSLIVGGTGAWTNGVFPPLLTAASVRSLAESSHLGGLHRLSLPAVPLGDEEAVLLAQSSGLSGLRELGASDKALGARGKRALRERFGDGLRLWSY